MVKDIQYFLERTEVNTEGCMIWTNCLNTDGYARALYKGDANGKVHRIIYELTTGEDITGKVIRHSCDTPSCINPEHLLVGTPKENMEDRGRRERHGNAKLTHEQVREIRILAKYINQTEIARKFNIDPRTVSSLLKGHHWKHVT